MKYQEFLSFYYEHGYDKKYGDLRSYEEMREFMTCDKVSNLYVRRFDPSAQVIIGLYPRTKLDENIETHAAILQDNSLVLDFTIRQFKRFRVCPVPMVETKRSFLRKFDFELVGIGKTWAQAYDNMTDH